MVLWEHPFERYLALASLVVIAVSLSILAVKRLTEPPLVIFEEPKRSPLEKPPPLRVHVKGAVKAPGVYTLPYGSRVMDALQKAKALPDADLHALNLAAFLEDGQEIFVPQKKGKEKSIDLLGLGALLTPQNRSPTARPQIKRPPIVHLNTATEADLMRLPGIGPVLAKRILEHRRRIGGFKSIDQLRDVPGIGEKKLEQLRPYLRL